MLQENEGTISTQDQPTGSDIFVSVEMSRSKWVVGIDTPLADKIGAAYDGLRRRGSPDGVDRSSTGEVDRQRV